MLAYVAQISQQLHWQNTRMSNVQVSFMNTADVMSVATVLANFQIQIAQDL